jgi:protein O-mannosyl-transferase
MPKVKPAKKPDPVIKTASPTYAFFKKDIYFILIIAALVFCLYAPALNYKFTNDDDVALIQDNYSFYKSPGAVKSIFTQSVFQANFKSGDSYYRPVLLMSFLTDTRIAGKHYWFFYLTNILLHLACCIMLFLLLQKLSYDKMRSFFFTILFAVHPVFAQVVAWLPCRNDTLLTLFALASIFFLINYLNSKKNKFLFFHLLFFAISLLTKETAVFLPILYFSYILLIHEKGKKISIIKSLTNSWLLVSGWVATTILFFIIRQIALKGVPDLPLEFIFANLITNTPAIIQYIGKIVLPFHLNSMPVLQDVPYYYGIATLLALLFFIWTTKKKNYKRIFFGAIWLVVFLVPAILRVTNNIETLFFEHRLYFPMVGFIIICLETDLIKKLDFGKRNTQLIFTLVAVFLFMLSWNHREDFKDEFHFWKSAAEGSPHSSAAKRGLGAYYATNGEPQKAEKEFIECLKINPEIFEVKNNLGRIYLDRGNYDAAEKLFLGEITNNPTDGMAYHNLGTLKFNQGNYSEAEQWMRKANAIDPEDATIGNDLAACLAMQRKYEEAIKVCIDILTKYPDYESPKEYIKKIFLTWDDKEKVLYYKELLTKKGLRIKRSLLFSMPNCKPRQILLKQYV